SFECVPSQKGLFVDPPQRQSENAGLPVRSHSRPSMSTNFTAPSTRYGPFGLTVIFTSAIMSLAFSLSVIERVLHARHVYDCLSKAMSVETAYLRNATLISSFSPVTSTTLQKLRSPWRLKSSATRLLPMLRFRTCR